MSETTAEQPDLPALPPEVLRLVLSLVDAPTRFDVCSLVSHQWRDAIAAVTNSVEADMSRSTAAARHARTASLQQFLQHLAAANSTSSPQLTRLCVSGAFMSRPQLLLQAATLRPLRELSVSSCRLTLDCTHLPETVDECSDGSGLEGVTAQASPEATATAPAAAPPPLAAVAALAAPAEALAARLTALQLRDCLITLQGSYPAAGWAVLSSLQCLNLQQLHWTPNLEPALSDKRTLCCVFDQLQQLTQLVLKQINLPEEEPLVAALAAGLANMSHLLELRLALRCLTGASLAALPCCLTLLELEGAQQLQFTAAACSQLGRLAAMQDLSIEGARALEPALLAGMPQLRRLKLRCTSSRWKPTGNAGTRALLAALPYMRNLQVLDLRNGLQHVLADAASASYTALTSSSQLRTLDLSGCSFPGTGDCGRLLFGPGMQLQLPHLEQLSLYQLFDPRLVGGVLAAPEDFGRIVSRCPNLRELSVRMNTGTAAGAGASQAEGAAPQNYPAGPSRGPESQGERDPDRLGARQQQQGQHASALASLAGLTALTMTGDGVSDAFACNTLVHLPQLLRLRLFSCRNFTLEGLRQLTQLTQLTYLLVERCDVDLEPLVQHNYQDTDEMLELQLCGKDPPYNTPVHMELQAMCQWLSKHGATEEGDGTPESPEPLLPEPHWLAPESHWVAYEAQQARLGYPP